MRSMHGTGKLATRTLSVAFVALVALAPASSAVTMWGLDTFTISGTATACYQVLTPVMGLPGTFLENFSGTFWDSSGSHSGTWTMFVAVFMTGTVTCTQLAPNVFVVSGTGTGWLFTDP